MKASIWLESSHLLYNQRNKFKQGDGRDEKIIYLLMFSSKTSLRDINENLKISM